MIRKIIAERLNISEDSINESSDIVEDLGANSLSVVEIIMDIGNEYDIQIPDEDAELLHTVGEVEAYISD